MLKMLVLWSLANVAAASNEVAMEEAAPLPKELFYTEGAEELKQARIEVSYQVEIFTSMMIGNLCKNSFCTLDYFRQVIDTYINLLRGCGLLSSALVIYHFVAQRMLSCNMHCTI